MATGIDAIAGAPRWWAYLRGELAPREGRWAAVARVTLCSSIVVMLWMLFRIPLAAYAAYTVFLVSGAEIATTLRTSIGAVIAAIIAIAFTLLLYTLDAAEPALRIPLMAGATFLGMFLSRVIAIGPIAFLVGFLLVLTQTLVDDVPDLENLTTFVLWLLLAAAFPPVLVSLVDLAFGQNPTQLARRKALRIFDAVNDALRQGDATHVRAVQADAAALADLRTRAELIDRELRSQGALDLALIESLDELVRITALLPARVPDAVRAPLAAGCRACRDAVANRAVPAAGKASPSPELLLSLDSEARPIVLAIAFAIERINTGLARRYAEEQGETPAETAAPAAKAFFVPDAFSNPEHARFALKATLATIGVYVLYSALDWPGIRTCMVTCFFVALGSIGETIHKLTLRLGGAIIGGLIAGLSIVFVLPNMTDIGQLTVLVAAVTALCAWISTSSELLAYAGMQMAFAFYLGVLQGYTPADDLTVLRDRVAGIVLGNVAMSLVFSTLWPVSAAAQARAVMASAASALGDLLRGSAESAAFGTRLAISRALNRARRLVSLSSFEAGLVPDRSQRRSGEEELLNGLEPLAAAAFVVVNLETGAAADKIAREENAAWLTAYGASLRAAQAPPAPPDGDAAITRMSTLPAETPVTARSAVEAQALLMSKIRDAAVHAG
jgi:multidrug resistance protein MdtO